MLNLKIKLPLEDELDRIILEKNNKDKLKIIERSKLFCQFLNAYKDYDNITNKKKIIKEYGIFYQVPQNLLANIFLYSRNSYEILETKDKHITKSFLKKDYYIRNIFEHMFDKNKKLNCSFIYIPILISTKDVQIKNQYKYNYTFNNFSNLFNKKNNINIDYNEKKLINKKVNFIYKISTKKSLLPFNKKFNQHMKYQIKKMIFELSKIHSNKNRKRFYLLNFRTYHDRIFHSMFVLVDVRNKKCFIIEPWHIHGSKKSMEFIINEIKSLLNTYIKNFKEYKIITIEELVNHGYKKLNKKNMTNNYQIFSNQMCTIASLYISQLLMINKYDDVCKYIAKSHIENNQILHSGAIYFLFKLCLKYNQHIKKIDFNKLKSFYDSYRGKKYFTFHQHNSENFFSFLKKKCDFPETYKKLLNGLLRL